MNVIQSPAADIGLLLEGTFPYVSGGVSGWVNQIIRGFPQYTFALIFVGSREEDYGELKYALPDNVVHLESHYLFSPHAKPPVKAVVGEKAVFDKNDEMHQAFRMLLTRQDQLHAAFREILPELMPGGKLSFATFLYGSRSWERIREQYRTYCTDPSFVDYFWTVRLMHQPIWLLANIAANAFPARVYHSVSTGYAGLLGAMLKLRTGKPLLLSEHGIYTKERKIDLFNSEWIKDNRSIFQRTPSEIGYLKELWILFFEALGKLCYQNCDQITALYEANRLRQVQEGAPPERTRNIPNGVDIERLAPLRRLRPEVIPPVLCLIGRVVPIKDVKTFIRAMRTVVNRLPDAEAWIAGPEDEDPAYAAECLALCESLGLAEHVKFLGFQKIADILPKIGLTILSSISEALPLVVLEGYAAGVPAICTDVGSCRQLVYGLDEEDRALGASGRIVGLADPNALAAAALELLTDPVAWQAAAQAGIARVERYYTQKQMFDSFGAIYQKALAISQHETTAGRSDLPVATVSGGDTLSPLGTAIRDREVAPTPHSR